MLEELASQAFWIGLAKVIAVAAAAGGSYVLLILGLAISIPLVVFGATLLIKLMERFPVIITIGAGLIGWVAGEMLVADGALASWFTGMGVEYRGENPYVAGWSLEVIAGLIGVVIVVALGKWFAARQAEPRPEAPADESRDHLEAPAGDVRILAAVLHTHAGEPGGERAVRDQHLARHPADQPSADGDDHREALHQLDQERRAEDDA